jgi:hypothetical protein
MIATMEVLRESLRTGFVLRFMRRILLLGMMRRLKGLVRRHWMVEFCRGPSLALRVIPKYTFKN